MLTMDVPVEICHVAKPIIGASFLSHFELLVDIKHRRLLNRTTSLSSIGRIATGKADSVKTIVGNTLYYQLITEFPNIARPTTIPGKNELYPLYVMHAQW